MHAIRIAGAGPSGLAAAITLAKAGWPVEVFERNADVGMRFSGDLQGLENWSTKHDVLTDLSTFGLEVNFLCVPFSAVTVTDGVNQETYDRGRPLFYLVKRGSMADSIDQGLKRQALAAGVNIHFSTKLESQDADIIATGPLTDRLNWVDQGIVFDTNLPDMAVAMPHDEAGIGGYGYLLITRGYGCLCTVLFYDLARANECFENVKLTSAKLVNLDIRNERRVGGTASFTIKNRWENGPHRFVGEAAGLQDPLWGFGIRYALWSGYLAAQSIIQQRSYAQLAQKAFGNRNRAGVVNRYLWEKFRHRRNERVVQRIGRSADPFATLRSFYNFNLLQRLLYPAAKRKFLDKYPRLESI
ncbi:MAG: NAD(P)-binding protein [Candidatus Kerfeldbacteria bacterium]|nr:NAD(P)-binding protein [Candidatus Kerfeldbacteria bacterium]